VGVAVGFGVVVGFGVGAAVGFGVGVGLGVGEGFLPVSTLFRTKPVWPLYSALYQSPFVPSAYTTSPVLIPQSASPDAAAASRRLASFAAYSRFALCLRMVFRAR
jgi:hypothetical protein